jgi:hypothetical protein
MGNDCAIWWWQSARKFEMMEQRQPKLFAIPKRLFYGTTNFLGNKMSFVQVA